MKKLHTIKFPIKVRYLAPTNKYLTQGKVYEIRKLDTHGDYLISGVVDSTKHQTNFGYSKHFFEVINGPQ